MPFSEIENNVDAVKLPAMPRPLKRSSAFFRKNIFLPNLQNFGTTGVSVTKMVDCREYPGPIFNSYSGKAKIATNSSVTSKRQVN